MHGQIELGHLAGVQIIEPYLWFRKLLVPLALFPYASPREPAPRPPVIP